MRKAMLMNNEHPVNRASHPKLVVLVSHSLEPCWYGWILLKERVFGAKSVVGKRVEVDGPRYCQAWVFGQTGLPEYMSILKSLY